MIVPMKKVSLIVLKSERKTALKELRKAGVIHLEDMDGSSAELTEVKNEFAKLENASLSLAELKVPNQKKGSVAPPSLSVAQATEKAVAINAFFSEKKTREEEIIKNYRELERFEKWGGFDPADVPFLSEKGINIALYECPVAVYETIPESVKTIFVNRDKTQTRFMLLEAGDQKPADMPPEAFLVPLLEKSTTQLKDEVAEHKKRIIELEKLIVEHCVYAQAIADAMVEMSKDVEFTNVLHGMGLEDVEHMHALAWLTGYVPVPKMAELKELATKEHWALSAEDPAEEDNVPTQLKNSPVSRLLYPVLDFLGTVPGYREYDITAWFLFFFTIFFAMIFGDAGYGSLLLLVGVAGTLSAVSKKKEIPLIMPLTILLGAATVAWGTVTCSWFGISPKLLPDFFRNIAVWGFSNENPEASTNIQIFCFSLALAQLSVGHVVALMRNVKEKSLKLFADVGSLGILWGMFTVVLNLLVSAERFPLGDITYGLIGGGFALSFIFSNYEGNIVKSILSSFSNIISVLLGVINFFSDIVSYIRLWAVGLAGAAIAGTVNTMAGPMLGGFIIFAGILLLVFGHGLNMALNLLSVIVHGVRLNTLEFTSHVGMAWSGFKYTPFKD